VKRDGVAGYGGRIILCESTNAARAATAQRVCDETGGSLVHPSNQPEVIAGQGTIALELEEQVGDLDAIITPIGGGGLISGVALAYRELKPSVVIVAAEPAGADDAFRSKEAGRLIPQTAPQTVADGLRTSLGSNTWPVVRDCVQEIVRVEDPEILASMRWIWERMKLVIEPSSATTLAALRILSDSGRFSGQRIGVVLSGGNVDLSTLEFG
jgi:threonine dehydratase